VNGQCSGSGKCCAAETASANPPKEYISLSVFKTLFSDGVSGARAEAFWPYFNEALDYASINTCLRVSAFVAQVGHESAGLYYFEELASGADYEWRTDLGNNVAGDGMRYKGRGPIQLTGRSNYKAAGSSLGLPFESDPERVAFPSGGFKAAAWYWKNHWSGNLNQYCDSGSLTDFRMLTQRINGGQNGAADREARWATAKSKLGCNLAPRNVNPVPPHFPSDKKTDVAFSVGISSNGVDKVLTLGGVDGTEPFSYEWYINDEKVAGFDSESSSIVLTSDRLIEFGKAIFSGADYYVNVTNAAGTLKMEGPSVMSLIDQYDEQGKAGAAPESKKSNSSFVIGGSIVGACLVVGAAVAAALIIKKKKRGESNAKALEMKPRKNSSAV
jgi:predicted chitinase